MMKRLWCVVVIMLLCVFVPMSISEGTNVDTEAYDVYDLLRANKIEVDTQGSGIQRVSVRIRRLVQKPLVVRFPVGSYFVSHDASVQNMVSTEDRSIRLTDDDWTRIVVPAACANIQRDIPGGSDRLEIQRSPDQEKLAAIMPLLEDAGADYATKQAAVWIVTDNSSYGDLGILVSRPPTQITGGTRIIREKHVAQAMKIGEGAGVDMTERAIWGDRHTILQGLEDGQLKDWLEAKL